MNTILPLEKAYNRGNTKKSMVSFNSREQVHPYGGLDAHIKAAGGINGFPTPVIESRNEGENGNGKVEPVRNGGELGLKPRFV